MNRPIEFRVWNKHLGKWIEKEWLPHSQHINEIFTSDDDCVFQQYTGIKDSQGKKVFEGDILIFNKDGYRDLFYTVAFSHGAFEVAQPDFKFTTGVDFCEKMIVVDNIFDKEQEEKCTKKTDKWTTGCSHNYD